MSYVVVNLGISCKKLICSHLKQNNCSQKRMSEDVFHISNGIFGQVLNKTVHHFSGSGYLIFLKKIKYPLLEKGFPYHDTFR